MARWVAIFEDDVAALWVRERHDKDHFAYLAQHRDRIQIAGGLRPEPGGAFCGGLWVIEAPARDDAARLCEDDPYYKLGLRRGYRLFAWGKAPVYADVVL
jgi:uncharacterized protein YciI